MPRASHFALVAALTLCTCRPAPAAAPSSARVETPLGGTTSGPTAAPVAEPTASALAAEPAPSAPAPLLRWSALSREPLIAPATADAGVGPAVRALAVVASDDGSALAFDEVFSDPTHGWLRAQPLDALGHARGEARVVMRISSALEGFEADARGDLAWVTFARRRGRSRSWFALAVKLDARTTSQVFTVGAEPAYPGVPPTARIVARRPGEGACVLYLNAESYIPERDVSEAVNRDCRVGMGWYLSCVGTSEAVPPTARLQDCGEALGAEWINRAGISTAAVGVSGASVFYAARRYDRHEDNTFLTGIEWGTTAPPFTPPLDGIATPEPPTTVAVAGDRWLEASLLHLVHLGPVFMQDNAAHPSPTDSQVPGPELNPTLLIARDTRDEAGNVTMRTRERAAHITGVRLRCRARFLDVQVVTSDPDAPLLSVGSPDVRLRLADWVQASGLVAASQQYAVTSSAWTGQRLLTVIDGARVTHRCEPDGALAAETEPSAPGPSAAP